MVRTIPHDVGSDVYKQYFFSLAYINFLSVIIDFSAACQVDPLKLNKQELIIMMDKKLIVSIQMSFAKGPVIKYSIALEFYKDVSINEKFIFVSYDEKISILLIGGVAVQFELNKNFEIRFKKSIN